MTKQRLSKLQKWILTNWDNKNLHKQMQIQPPETENLRNSLWVYYNFFGIKNGEATFNGTDYDGVEKTPKEKYKDYPKQSLTPNKHFVIFYRGYKVQNKYSVIVYRSIVNLEKKGLISIYGRCMSGRGNLLFELTEKGKELSLMLSKKLILDNHLTINNIGKVQTS